MRLDSLRRLVRPGSRSAGASSGSTPTADLDNFLANLHELITQMDRSSPSSFAHSFAGEFDVRDYLRFLLII